MSELTADKRAELGAALIEQSPPGEVNDVINAIRAIVGDDGALMAHAGPALRSYNLAQLTVVEHPAQGSTSAHTSLLSEAAILPGSDAERYIDATGKQSFAFDHINMVAGEYEAYDLPEEEETFRAALAKSLAAYTKNHFSTGQSSVNCSQFPLLPPAPPTPPSPAPAPAEAVPESSSAVPEEAISEPPQSSADPAVADGVVTDVVPEQVGSGAVEPAPTPSVGDSEVKDEDVVLPATLVKVDEAVEEVKADEAGAGGQTEDAEPMDVNNLKIDDARENEDSAGTTAPGKPVVVEEEAPVPASSAEARVDQDEAQGTEPSETKAAEPIRTRKQEWQENPTYTLEIVGNRYKTDAFWTGRWRTRWTVDRAAGLVSGNIKVDVHYFEQGNVQLSTTHDASFPYPSEVSGQSIASQIVTTISKVEAAYQSELQDVYGDLGDKAFRSLRRALPVTRQKVDWEKVGGYSLGSDISKARA